MPRHPRGPILPALLMILATTAILGQPGPAVIDQTVDRLAERHGDAIRDRAERGVRHAGSLWTTADGNPDAFQSFCLEHFIADETGLRQAADRLSEYLEAMWGHHNATLLALQRHVHEDTGPLTRLDTLFAAFNPGAHLSDDLYANRIAFVVALNFPRYELVEKNDRGATWDAWQWAAARLGDIFVRRVPAGLVQAAGRAGAAADLYISQYNIHMGCLRTEGDDKLFRDDQVLLSHWNLRDEIKANYADPERGLTRQRLVYRVMQRIVDQTIPAAVIDSPAVTWWPESNRTERDGQPAPLPPEPDTRYRHLMETFQTLRAMDVHGGPGETAISRQFSESMEIPQAEVERIFDQFLSAPLFAKVARLVEQRLGRKLEAFDIWYDGFKARSAIAEETLTAQTRQRFPDAAAFQAAMPDLLEQLGFETDKARWLGERIRIDPARGSGHAWGAAMRGQASRLRTRIPSDGMDYKGFNIAIHEFGHNVEQTISLYDVPHFALNGVPNTAFTEALAFLFQKRDLTLLGHGDGDPRAADLQTLDTYWSTAEIMGVSLVDMKVWQWLYANPEATPTELKEAVQRIAREVWNRYFAPAYGTTDQTILAVYSHMISYPLYLSAYAFGRLIEFQLDEHLRNRPFGPEVGRIFAQGRLTPRHWMIGAVGSDLSAKPLSRTAEQAWARLTE